jgi:poly(A) polymerase
MSFGVVEVIGPRTDDGHLQVEVATFRSDTTYSDGRHPDSVVFSTPRDDALRRDFTINGMFFDPLEDKLIDYVGGRHDLDAGILRAIGDPELRFAEDKLRMLRAVRIATRFNLQIEEATALAIRDHANEITAVSAERIGEELCKLLVQPRRAYGVNLLMELGLASPVLPEIVPMKGLPQGPPDAPTGDLWDHVVRLLDLLGDDVSFPLAFAALLHDVGKPRTVGRTPDRFTFYYHEHVGRRLAAEICERLRYSNADRTLVEWLVEKHQFLCDVRQMRLSKVKTTLAHPHIRELLALHRADALAWGNSTDHVDYCEELLRQWTDADLNPAPLVTGHDLAQLGLEPGPIYKRLLDAVREAQLEGTVTTHDEALHLVQRLWNEPGEEKSRGQ